MIILHVPGNNLLYFSHWLTRTCYVNLLEAVPGLLYAEVKAPLPSYVLCDKL